MKNSRTIAILGAGTILDFDFNGMVTPSTRNITDAVVGLKVQGFNLGELDLIKQVYDLIVAQSRAAYLHLHPAVRNYDPQVSFEELFEVIETLHSYNGTWKKEQYPFPLVSGILHSDLHFESVEYYRAMLAIISKIVEIVLAYDEQFRGKDRELWYKDFWKGFGRQLDVFNLNYDNTVEYSLVDYVDGFVGFTQYYERFEPEVLWNADANKPSVNHLHGCVLYGDVNPKPTEFYYSHRDLYKFYPNVVKEAFFSGQWLPTNQAGDTVLYSPIITGLKKTDKICYMPQSFYHANLVKKIIENPSLLICGYSFSDLYLNQLLQRHKLIHGDKERVVIVEKWPVYVNEDNISLYRYFMDNTSGGIKEFVSRMTEGGREMLAAFKQFKQLSDFCWESPNSVLRIYTSGMKEAVESEGNEILKYLYGQ